MSKFDEIHRKIYYSTWATRVRAAVRSLLGLPPSQK